MSSFRSRRGRTMTCSYSLSLRKRGSVILPLRWRLGNDSLIVKMTLPNAKWVVPDPSRVIFFVASTFVSCSWRNWFAQSMFLTITVD